MFPDSAFGVEFACDGLEGCVFEGAGGCVAEVGFGGFVALFGGDESPVGRVGHFGWLVWLMVSLDVRYMYRYD